MNCPYCNKELVHDDTFFSGGMRVQKKQGDIYKCDNEECESSVFNYSFYTRIGNDELKEGYPC